MKAALRRQLRAQGITQRELAHRLGVTEAAISQILSAQGNPTVRTLIRISVALECHLEIRFEAATSNPALSEQERLWHIAA